PGVVFLLEDGEVAPLEDEVDVVLDHVDELPETPRERAEVVEVDDHPSGHAHIAPSRAATRRSGRDSCSPLTSHVKDRARATRALTKPAASGSQFGSSSASSPSLRTATVPARTDGVGASGMGPCRASKRLTLSSKLRSRALAWRGLVTSRAVTTGCWP